MSLFLSFPLDVIREFRGDSGSTRYLFQPRHLAVLAVALFFSVDASGQSQLGPGLISNYIIPAMKDAQGRTIGIKGNTARNISNEVFELTGLTLTISGGLGNSDFIVEAKSCLWDQKTGLTTSSGSLSLRSADGLFALSGEGFRFDAKKSALVVSNAVTSRISKSFSGAPGLATISNPRATTNASNIPASRAGARTNELVEISSTTFDFTPERVEFRGTVQVRDGESSANSERLTGRFAGNGGGIDRIDAEGNVRFAQGDLQTSSESALFSPATGRATLRGSVQWQLGTKEGTADELAIESTAGRFVANGNVSVKVKSVAMLPLSWLAPKPEAQSAREILIRSHGLEYAQDKARFTDMVLVTDSAGTQLSSGILNLGFDATNGIATLAARDSVQLTSGDIVLSGSRADYSAATGLLEFNGEPVWTTPQGSGTSDLIVLDSKEKEFRAAGNVHATVSVADLPFPKLDQAGAKNPTPPRPATPRMLKIDSDRLVALQDKTVFLGNAHVHDAADLTQDLRAEVLAAFFGATNKLEHLLAENAVRIQSGAGEAIGEKAEFNVARDQIVLSGSPRVRTPGRSIAADRFVFDRSLNKVEIIGKYRIEWDLQPMGITKPQ